MIKKMMKAIKDKVLARSKKKTDLPPPTLTEFQDFNTFASMLKEAISVTSKIPNEVLDTTKEPSSSREVYLERYMPARISFGEQEQMRRERYTYGMDMMYDPYYNGAMTRRNEELEWRRRRDEERGRYFPPSIGMIGEYGVYDSYRDPYADRRMERRPGTAIVCPVCTSDRCGWWEEQIMRNTAGTILKDMLTTGFKGEGYYERYGGSDSRQQQEEYYQRMKARFEAANMSKPEPVKTEDVDHDVVSTDIKGKPKKQIAFTIKDAEPNQY